ncbi:MAG: 3-phosphoglycerate dehydrogenase, partial [Planctomycetes bacterium]|nr:3-phosphoglycerate dehydrogenase [Planctomycetota bacterium]
MKCLVVGDLFIPAAVMREKLPAGMFDSVEMLEWGGEDRSAMRNKIRNIETGGYAAEPPAESMAEAIRDCDAIMLHMCPVPTAIIEAAPKLR